MKKNLLSILILALLIVNIVLTAIMMFSTMSATKKTSQLVTDIASVLKLEIEGSAGGPAVREVPLSQTETYNINELTIGLRPETTPEGEEAGPVKYCLGNIVLSMDTKSKGYKNYGDAETMAKYESLISSEINNIIGSYSMDELTAPSGREEVRVKILESVQKMFDSDFIYNVSISDIKFS